jgi:alpha-L-fucosidase 2
MKSEAQWANYPAAAAWMMQHVFDHWDYLQDVEWPEAQGYPMTKGVAGFWLSQLQEDAYTRDNTLAVNLCNSPEHGPTTLGCAHYQQLIHQVLDAVLSISSVTEEPDKAFLTEISTSLARLDKGFHVGDWGKIKEWKLPDSEGYDFINDTHRHLSELIGWYPGYSLLLHGRLCKRHYSERRSREAIQPRRGQGR